MATATRTISDVSRVSSGSSSADATAASSPRGGGILANAHEASKKPIKAADNSFTSALKSAFIPQQAGKQMKCDGKPLGKTFERTQPLATRGHEGGEILKKDPRGVNAPCGDGVVLTEDIVDADEDDAESTRWSPTSEATTSDSLTSSSLDSASESSWDQVPRGRSDTMSSSMSRSISQASSQSSRNNPCSIKFAPLPSSGRLKRANSITIGVAARSQLLQSQGGGRSSNNNSNAAAWQAQYNASRYGGPQSNTQAQVPQPRQQTASVIRADDTVDLGEELRKGALKAWRRMKRGNSVSSSTSSSSSVVDDVTSFDKESTLTTPVQEEEEEEEEEQHDELAGGEKTPGRSHSPLGFTSFPRDLMNEEPEGTQTPRHGAHHRRLSTGAFTGNRALMEIEEKRRREGLEGEDKEGDDIDEEEKARFADALGQTHASRTAGHHYPTEEGSWKASHGSNLNGNAQHTEVKEVFQDALEDDAADYDDEDDDEESKEAERMADEALHAHSAKATKAGAVEKMERKQA
ncbi:hypothetical protein CBS101457_002165 [Exobasidium rhododendri]|nr:hypothetical protein CBS101457_002165 [Exobasidium rhododendri]